MADLRHVQIWKCYTVLNPIYEFVRFLDNFYNKIFMVSEWEPKIEGSVRYTCNW